MSNLSTTPSVGVYRKQLKFSRSYPNINQAAMTPDTWRRGFATAGKRAENNRMFEYKCAFHGKRTALAELLDVSDRLLNRLLDERVIEQNHFEAIKAMKEDTEGQSNKLLDILLKRSNDTFASFVKVLVETGQRHLVELMLLPASSPDAGEKAPSGSVSCFQSPLIARSDGNDMQSSASSVYGLSRQVFDQFHSAPNDSPGRRVSRCHSQPNYLDDFCEIDDEIMNQHRVPSERQSVWSPAKLRMQSSDGSISSVRTRNTSGCSDALWDRQLDDDKTIATNGTQDRQATDAATLHGCCSCPDTYRTLLHIGRTLSDVVETLKVFDAKLNSLHKRLERIESKLDEHVAECAGHRRSQTANREGRRAPQVHSVNLNSAASVATSSSSFSAECRGRRTAAAANANVYGLENDVFVAQSNALCTPVAAPHPVAPPRRQRGYRSCPWKLKPGDQCPTGANNSHKPVSVSESAPGYFITHDRTHRSAPATK